MIYTVLFDGGYCVRPLTCSPNTVDNVIVGTGYLLFMRVYNCGNT